MSKATRMLNKYHMKELLLHGNPEFENFYKDELIQFCEVARELLRKFNDYKIMQFELEKYVNSYEYFTDSQEFNNKKIAVIINKVNGDNNE